MRWIHIKEGIRIFNSSRDIKSEGYDHIDGSSEEICKRIVDSCWNGRFFMTSTSNFSQFWTRDFGWCAESLLDLGYKLQVELTLKYALDIFKKHNRVTTTITPDGVPYDFPNYGVDSLPFLLSAIKKSGFDVSGYRDFLNKKLKEYEDRVYCPETGIVKCKRFSSIKDYSKRRCTAYGNSMLASLARDAKDLGLETTLDYGKIRSNMLRSFWNGSYFFEDIGKTPNIASDANLFPFFMEIFNDRNMLENSIESLIYAGLEKPLPLIYSKHKGSFIWQEIFVKDYEGRTVWAHIGMIFIKLLLKYDREKAGYYLHKYAEVIEKYGNFLEAYDTKLNPFITPFYTSDQSMLWASIFLDLFKKLNKRETQ